MWERKISAKILPKHFAGRNRYSIRCVVIFPPSPKNKAPRCRQPQNVLFIAKYLLYSPSMSTRKGFLVPPALNHNVPETALRRRHALLLNPFYPKDPHASFGKHVLTPSLALTSIAASTPDNWTVEYWDENLLQGPPPSDPIPEVVGISVHLTFARRAFELARWYR